MVFVNKLLKCNNVVLKPKDGSSSNDGDSNVIKALVYCYYILIGYTP